MDKLDELWNGLLMDALASDGAIADQDVKNAIKRWRPRIEAAVAEQTRQWDSIHDAEYATSE